jgi:indolepyruvate ferredoxin oxidoreductase beta subunit
MDDPGRRVAGGGGAVRYDLILAGVGGQGVLSMAAIIGNAAIAQGLFAKLSEVHGMAQRGGAVNAHLRLSDRPIESDLVPRGTADLVLGMEPVETLRYLEYLAPHGTVVASSCPLVNIPDYPDLAAVLEQVRRLPHALVIDAERLAAEAGDPQTLNTVMVGAACHLLPLEPGRLEAAVSETFARKGSAALAINRAAFGAGRAAAEAAGSVAR